MMFRMHPCGLDFVETAPFVYENRVNLALPPERAFELVSQIEYEREWFPDFAQAHWVTPGPPGVGSIRDYRLTYMRLLEHFIAWEPGKHMAFWVSECSLPLTRQFLEDYRMEPSDDGGTLLRWRVCYTPTPWLRPLHPLLRPWFGRDFRTAANNLQICASRIAADAIINRERRARRRRASAPLRSRSRERS